MEEANRWTCPRCGAAPPDPVKCACGLSRRGWMTGPAQYSYGTGQTRIDVSRSSSGPAATSIFRLTACKNCGKYDCPADGGEELVAIYEGERYDLLALT